MRPQIKLSLYFSLQVLIMALLCAFLLFILNSLSTIISLNITAKSFSLLGIYTYTLGFAFALALMLIFRKKDLPFYLNQGLSKIQLICTAYAACLIIGLTIQFMLGSLG